jgi:hypothetical protein
MTKPSKRRKASGDYQVGYGRPPSGSRFQPGKSGNPCGRPKGVKSIGQVLADALQRVVTIQEGGRQKKTAAHPPAAERERISRQTSKGPWFFPPSGTSHSPSAHFRQPKC